MPTALEQTVQQAKNKFYGKYRAFVVNNQDPEHRGRVQVIVPSVFGKQESFWCLPCLPFGGLDDQGFFMVPEVDAQVWVEFEEGNTDMPIWTGVFWQPQRPVPDEAKKASPTTRIIKTPSGHVLQFDDDTDAERVILKHTIGSELSIDEKGTTVLADQNGGKLTLDAEANSVTLEDGNGNKMVMSGSTTTVSDGNGNEIEMSAAGINVKGNMVTIEGSQVAIGGMGGEPLIKGASFLAMFATHMHTCSAPGGPTSPPIPQGEMSTLTSNTTAL